MSAIRLQEVLVTRRLGAGAMGSVWEGQHLGARLAVAVKVLAGPAAREARFRGAFDVEIRALARLDHPHVVRIHDFGHAPAGLDHPDWPEGAPYFVMERAPLGSLDAWSGRLDAEGLRSALRQLLSALAHAHAHGFVHRDVKPANLLVFGADGGSPRVRLADFGIATQGASALRAGSPGYMAPEQASGGRLGPWTDLFAVARTLAALATGDPIADPSALGPELAAWARVAGATEPEARFPTVADAIAALTDAKVGFAPVRAAPRPTTSEATWIEEAAEEPDLPVVEARIWPAPPLGEPSPDLARDWAHARAGLSLFELRPPPFAGREAERRALWEALRDVEASGRPQVLRMRGEAGAGRSRLAGWLAIAAREAGRSAWVASLAEEGADRALCRALAAHLGLLGAPPAAVEGALRRLPLDAIGAEALRRAVRYGLRSATDAGPGWVDALVEQLASATAGGRGAVVVLDDVDQASGAAPLIRALRSRALPVLIVAIGGPAMAAEPGEATLEVGPLPAAAMQHLATAGLGLELATAAEVCAVCSGSPGLLVGIVRSWVATASLVPGFEGLARAPGAPIAPPPTLAAAVEARLVGAADRGALEILAVLGPVGAEGWRAAAQAAEIDPEAVDRLEAARLAQRDADGRWTLALPGAANVLLAGIPVEQAHRLHLAAALAFPSSDPDDVSRRALHLTRAGRVLEATPDVLAAAWARLDRGEAAALLPELLAWWEAFQGAGAPPEHPAWVDGRVTLALCCRNVGRREDFQRWASEAQAHAGPAPAASRSRAARVAARAALLFRNPDEAARLAHVAHAAAVESGDARCLADAYLAIGQSQVANSPVRWEALEAAHIAYQRAADPVGEALVLALLAAYYHTIDPERSERAARDVIACAERIGDAHLWVRGQQTLAQALMTRSPAAAEVALRAAIDRGSAMASQNVPYCWWLLGLAVLKQSRLADAEVAFARAESLGGKSTAMRPEDMALWQAAITAAQGRPELLDAMARGERGPVSPATAEEILHALPEATRAWVAPALARVPVRPRS